MDGVHKGDPILCKENDGGCTFSSRTYSYHSPLGTRIRLHFVSVFVPVLTTLCMLGLKVVELSCMNIVSVFLCYDLYI